jgi:ribosome-associated protein
MDIQKLQRTIVQGLEDVKAQNIQVFDTEHLSALFERVIVACGTSNRQTKALAASVRDAVRDAGFPILSTEGEGNGEWVIVDCAAAVVHIMQPSIREYYHLEEIWGEKPIALEKLLAAAKKLQATAKASNSKKIPSKVVAKAVKTVAVKKIVAKKTVLKKDLVPIEKVMATKKAVAKKVTIKKTIVVPVSQAVAAKKVAKKAAPIKKTAPTVSVVTRTVGVKRSTSTQDKTQVSTVRATKLVAKKPSQKPVAKKTRLPVK